MVALHAVALLIVLSSPVMLWFMRRSGATQPFLKNIVYVVPFLIVGGVCSLLLSINGVPLSEWAIPAFVVIAAALIAPSASVMRSFSMIVFFACIALCAEGLWLRESGYTSNSTMTANARAAVSRAVLSNFRDKLEKQQLRPAALPKPLNELLDGEIPNVESVRVVPEWHTPITGLLKITRSEQKIWVVGMDGKIPQLEARPL